MEKIKEETALHCAWLHDVVEFSVSVTNRGRHVSRPADIKDSSGGKQADNFGSDG